MTIHEQLAPDSRQRKCYEERQGQVRGGEAAGGRGSFYVKWSGEA